MGENGNEVAFPLVKYELAEVVRDLIKEIVVIDRSYSEDNHLKKHMRDYCLNLLF